MASLVGMTHSLNCKIVAQGYADDIKRNRHLMDTFPDSYTTETIKFTAKQSFFDNATFFHIIIADGYELRGCARLLAWAWAVFGSAFGGISINCPTWQ
jgi:hypothetical protein